MTQKEIIEEIKLTDWNKYSGQEYYFPKEVSQSLINLVTMDKDAPFIDTYNDVLSTIGNNHAGAYYPATIEAVKFIIWTALNGETETARYSAIEILIALYATFNATTEQYNLLTREEVELKVNSLIEGCKEKFKAQKDNPLESEQNKQSLVDLIESIDERTLLADT